MNRRKVIVFSIVLILILMAGLGIYSLYFSEKAKSEKLEKEKYFNCLEETAENYCRTINMTLDFVDDAGEGWGYQYDFRCRGLREFIRKEFLFSPEEKEKCLEEK